jgi:hypothetical protein
LYPNVGHGFARPDNQIDFNGRAELFLAKCLGGQAEELDKPKGSTAQFPLETRVNQTKCKTARQRKQTNNV